MSDATLIKILSIVIFFSTVTFAISVPYLRSKYASRRTGLFIFNDDYIYINIEELGYKWTSLRNKNLSSCCLRIKGE